MLKNVNALKVRFFLLTYSCFLRFCLNDQDENDEVKMLHCYIFIFKLKHKINTSILMELKY